MRKSIMIALAAAAVCSCTKEGVEENVVPVEESVVRITLQNEDGTRATGSGHGNQTLDNTINTLEVFIFRISDDATDGTLDGYRKFGSDEVRGLTDLEVRTTIGRKMIYVVANAHIDNWGTDINRSKFESLKAELIKENVKDFLMVGSKEETLELSSTVNMSIKRMVARVKLNYLKTSFENTPYEGCALTNVKVYLINVQGEKYLYDGSGDDLKVFNSRKYQASDMAGWQIPGLLYDELTTNVDDTGYLTSHYFYCYENNITEEDELNRFTRLVIEADLDGTTYYYPVAIPGIERNNCYTIEVRIQRPGVLTPEENLEFGALSLNIDVLDWNAITPEVVEF